MRFDVGAVKANDDINLTGDTPYGESRVIPAVSPPTVTIQSPSSNSTFTHTTPFTLSGTASDNVAVTQVTWTNDRGGSGTCIGTANWTCGNIALQSGANNLTVQASDAAGNVGQAARTVVLDTTLVTVTTTSPTLNPTYATNISTLTLSGTVSANLGITQVTWTNDRGGSGTCIGTTSWTCSNIALQSGVNNLTVRASDTAGNIGQSMLAVTFDTALPTVTITSPTSNPTYATHFTSITLGGTASDSSGITQVTWTNDRGGSGSCAGASNWTCSVVALQSGVNTLTVRASDAAGNVGQRMLVVTIETTPPTLTITSPTSNPTYLTKTQITLSGTASDNVAVTQVTLTNGTCTGTTNWSCNVFLLPGVNNVSVVARDAAGNVGQDTLTVTLDPLAPTVTIRSPTLNPTLDTGTTPIVLGGGASDCVVAVPECFVFGSVTSVTWTNNRGGSGTCTGTIVWICSDLPLLAGANVLTISAVDAAQNTGADTITVNLITSGPLPPTLSQVNPTVGIQGNNVNVALTGTGFLAGMTVDAGSGITVSNVNVDSATTGSATFAIVFNAPPGARIVTVSTSNGTSGPVMFTVNSRLPPTLSQVSPGGGIQGSSVDVTLTGTEFSQELTVDAGSDITVSNVDVHYGQRATASFAIASSAAPGPRNVTVTIPGGTSGAASFTVNPPPPTLSQVNPTAGAQGRSVNVTLTGTGFLAGMTVNAGSGITVLSDEVNVVSSTSATARFIIASNAALGQRDIAVTIPGQTSNSNTVTFDVVVAVALPDLTITSTHTSDFSMGFSETYTIRVNNVGTAAPASVITVTDTLPAGLVPVSATGTNWSCVIAAQTVTCTTTALLPVGLSLPPITLQVSVSRAAASSVIHAPTVATTGDQNSANNSAADVTSVVATPVPDLVFSPSPLEAGQQATVGLTLAAPFPRDVTGALTLSFSSNAAIPADDPVIQFASGGRQAAFTIAANALQARFSGNAAEGPIGFQTGTVAGTLGFIGALQTGTALTTLSPPSSALEGLMIPPAAPSIQSVQTNTQNGFVAVINLFSTMREVTHFSLTFNTTTPVRLSCGAASGCSVSGTTMTFEVKGLFDAWFNSASSVGSLSSLRLPLSIQGSIRGTVQVTLQNTLGMSNSASFDLP